MQLKIQRPVVLATLLILSLPLGIRAQQSPADGKTAVVPIAAAGPAARLLPANIGGSRATAEIKQFTGDDLTGLTGDKAAIYKEYRVTSAASRLYGSNRIDTFETQDDVSALALFSFNAGLTSAKPIEREPGYGAARLDGEVVFWKGNVFVRVADINPRPFRGNTGLQDALARAVAEAIIPRTSAKVRPPLLDSLPPAGLVPRSQVYFLGSESLNAFVEHGREMFEFAGDTEAVLGQYEQREGASLDTVMTPAAPETTPATTAAPVGAPGSSDSLLKLLIVESHTPQFATDAMSRVAGYVESLPEADQQHIIFSRVGNYVVVALNVRNRELAQGLVNSVQYPYTVKWLRNPLWPTNDPFRMEKTANMLLSTFGLLGLILMTVLVVGSVFGTTIFLKRRKQQREVFSDAGGMLRLDIDPFETVLLGLPPKRSNEE